METQPSLFDRYPNAPGYKARDTAKLSARQSAPKAPRLRNMVYDMLLLRGPLTADECAAYLHVDRLAIRPRFSELAATGRIADTTERRLNDSGKKAIVWRAACPKPG